MKYLHLVPSFLLIMACTASKKQISQSWEFNPEHIQLDTAQVNRWAFESNDTSIDTKNSSKSIEFQAANLDIQIVGHTAQFRLQFTIKNNLNRPLEGTFNMPMPDGAQVNHLAMDIKGQMRQAVIVDKEKGRVVFEDISRQKMDPALLEQTSENIYRLRIFPLPANGTRIIEIGFDQELGIQGNALVFWNSFAMNPEMEKLHVHMNLVGIRTAPVSILPGRLLGDSLHFKPSILGYEADFIAGNANPVRLFCAINPLENSAIPVISSIDEQRDLVSFIQRSTLGPRKRIPANRVLILWDASASASTVSNKLGIEFLTAYTKQHPETEYDLQVLHYPLEPVQKKMNGPSLLSAIHDVHYDGGSYFSLPNEFEATECWYFSDGLLNLNDYPEKIDLPLISFIASPQANSKRLRYISENSGGQLINLARSPLDSCLFKIGVEYPQLLQVKGAKGEDFSPSLNQNMTEDCWVHIPVEKGKERIQLVIGFPNGPQETIDISFKESTRSSQEINQRAWANSLVKQYEAAKVPNAKEKIKKLAQRYHLVSSENSLLVLDTLLDYVRYEVEPAEANLKAEYHLALAQKNKVKDEDNALHAKQVRADYLEFKKRLLNETAVIPEKTSPPLPIIQPNNPTPNEVEETEEVEEAELRNDNDSTGLTYTWADSTDAIVRQYDLGNVRFQVNMNGSVASLRSNYEVAGNIGFLEIESDMIANGVISPAARGKVKLIPFEPNSPEFQAWKKLKANEVYNKYMEKRDLRSSSPAFYMDVAQLLIKKGAPDLAVRVLGNLAEMEVESPELLRVLASQYLQLKEEERAVYLYKRIIHMKGEDPQSYRDYALALELTGNYQEAFNNLTHIIKSTWDTRFPSIEQIAIEEVQHVWVKSGKQINTDSLSKEYLEFIPRQLRIVMDWDTDNCDLDLWVTSSNEKCYYSHRFASDGGILSKDFVGGYGPEVYQLRKSPKGERLVQVHYFGQSANKVLGNSMVSVKIYKNYGAKNESRQVQNIQLEGTGRVIEVAEIEF